MKTVLNLLFAVLTVIAGLSVSALAQDRNPRQTSINERQRNQQERIYKGIKSGELTAREASRLERRQARIYKTERRFRNSGDGLTRSERARLQYRLLLESSRIYNQKHDRQDTVKP